MIYDRSGNLGEFREIAQVLNALKQQNRCEEVLIFVERPQNEHSIYQACRSNRRQDDFRVGESAADWGEATGLEDRRGGRFSVSVSLDSCRKELSEQRFDSHTLP
jgi:hypothetical protein